MHIKLRSDFYDYYDHWFAGTGQRSSIFFDRPTRSRTSRIEDFRLMERNGLNVIRHNTVANLYDETRARVGDDLMSLLQLVVYTDEYAHAGEGKSLLTFEQAIKKYPDNLASEYLPVQYQGALSYRYLRVGKRQFWLRYESLNDWRSNSGDVNVELLCEEKPADSFLINPIFAVDFLRINKTFIALDYNPSPMINKTGIEKLMSPKEAFQQIQAAIAFFADGSTPYVFRLS